MLKPKSIAKGGGYTGEPIDCKSCGGGDLTLTDVDVDGEDRKAYVCDGCGHAHILRKKKPTLKETRERAKAMHHDEGTCEIDDNAKVSRGDGERGAYVQAWVWVPDPD